MLFSNNSLYKIRKKLPQLLNMTIFSTPKHFALKKENNRCSSTFTRI